MPPPPHDWSPDWHALWRYGACWAGRPVAGLILPGVERRKIMTSVIEQLLATHPVLPGSLQTHAFIQSSAVQGALSATRMARQTSGVPDLWHDPSHRGTTPVIDLESLQQHPESRNWQALFAQLKPRAMGVLRGQGFSTDESEDLFAEAIANMVKQRKDGTAAVQDLLVYEQVPSLFLSILRRRAINYVRDRNAQKRAAHSTVSLQGNETVEDITAPSTFASWAAESADPLHGMTMARLASECSHGLSHVQQRILATLYIEESADYMEVASSPWFMHAMGIKPGASDATRRRALDKEHDCALEHLAKCLGIDRQKN